MEGLWCLMIVGCACHFLSSPGVSGVMIDGTPKQCEAAKFVPGYNLAGEGLDIVTMQRKGAYVINLEGWRRQNGTCTLVQNSYLGNTLQKLPTAMVDWRALSKCKMSVQSKLYESSESLVNDTTSSVTNDWKIGLDIQTAHGVRAGWAFGGTHSREANFAMEKSKKDKYSFTSHEVHCRFYRYRLASQLPLHKDFADSIKSLPKKYNCKSKSSYMALIDTYGTHYITDVHLGGKLKDVTAIRSCKAAMTGLSDTAVMDCLQVEASVSYLQTASLKAEYRRCQAMKKKKRMSQSFNSMFSERHAEVVGGNIKGVDLLFSGRSNSRSYRRWMESLRTTPDIVLYSIKPLFFLIKERDPARAGMKRAIGEYIGKKALVKRCSESCRPGNRRSARDRCACICHADSQITANCCPSGPGKARLTVYRLYARKLWGDRMTQTDGSVRVTYANQIKRTSVIQNNDNPNWRETFDFGRIELNMAARVNFEVYDEDSYWNSDLLGKCSFPLRQGSVSDACYFDYGTFFFSYRVSCGPSLGGTKCQDYIPSPMNPSLAKSFHSRNGFLAGDNWETLLAGNSSEGLGPGCGFEDHGGE